MKEEVNTEQAILQAAEKEFLEKGYALSKTTEIARAAGVTHAMLHYYFRTKENLFDKVFQLKAHQFAETFSSNIQEDMPFTELITKAIEAHFDLLSQNPKLPFFVISEILANEQRKETCRNIFIPFIQKTLEKIKQATDKAVSEGIIHEVNPVDLMMNIISLNVFVFIAHPLVNIMNEELPESYAEFLEHRKKENVKTILASLKK